MNIDWKLNGEHGIWRVVCWCREKYHSNEGDKPNGKSQKDSLSFGVAASMGLQTYYHTQLEGFSFVKEDFGASQRKT